MQNVETFSINTEYILAPQDCKENKNFKKLRKNLEDPQEFQIIITNNLRRKSLKDVKVTKHFSKKQGV